MDTLKRRIICQKKDYLCKIYVAFKIENTVRPRSSDPFYIVILIYIKWVTYSWTHENENC